jgi:anti-sigma B factor antagonist
MNESPNYVRIEVPLTRLDAAAAPELRRQLTDAPHHDRKRLLLDISKVQFIDSTGLGVLVSILKQMAPGGRIAVVGARPAPMRLFQITGLDKLFALCADPQEAERVLET